MLKNFAFWAIVSFSALSLTVGASNAQTSGALKLWLAPSYFRGFVISPNVPISSQDILDVKSFGATLAYLATDGFRYPTAPYEEDSANIQALDERVGYCRAAGIHYAIAVRQGPGRYDVALETSAKPSTIWYDSSQQRIYGSMLREITARYCSDTFCVGITPTVEPNPFFDSLCCIDTSQFEYYATRNSVDLNAITQLWVDSIRSALPDIPILIQGPAYSNPTLFNLVPIIPDSNVVYEFHDYHPTGFTEAADTAQVFYPGAYYDIVNGMLDMAEYNKAFIADTLLDYVSQVEAKTHAPIFMGEFGMTFPHSGGPQFLADMSSVAIEKGWHFTYFDYWHRPAGSVDASFDYRDWDGAYWSNILASLVQDNSSVNENNTNTGGLIVSRSSSPGELSVYWPMADQSLATEVEIYDILGRPVQTSMENSSRFLLDLSGLGNGVYLLVLSSGQATAHALVSGMR